MLQVGDTVVTMGAPGRFEVIAVNGEEVIIQNAQGLRKTVLERSLRRINHTPTAATST